MRRGTEVLLASGLLALTAYRLGQGGLLDSLLAAQTAIVAVLLLIRRAPLRQATWKVRVLAWWSAFLPLLMRPGPDAILPVALQVIGVSVAVWAQGCLAESFGVTPADRGLVTSGPYCWLRHPTYAGELINFIGVWVSAPTLWNTTLLLVVGLALVLRIGLEESLIDGYAQYAARVRWRLAPGLW